MFVCLFILCTVQKPKGGHATFRNLDGHSRKDGSPYFRCACGKRERRTGTGEVSLLLRSHVPCVSNH